jgi:hypothetical protein
MLTVVETTINIIIFSLPKIFTAYPQSVVMSHDEHTMKPCPLGLCRFMTDVLAVFSSYAIIVLVFFGWDETESTWYIGHLFGLLYQPRVVDDECGAISELRIGREN